MANDAVAKVRGFSLRISRPEHGWICDSFLREVWEPGAHAPDAAYYCALYRAGAYLDETTRMYTPEFEVASQGYVAGGARLGLTTRRAPDGGLTWSWPVLRWERVTVTARQALIYNRTRRDKAAVCVLDWGEDVIAVNGQFGIAWGWFTIPFPRSDGEPV